MQKLADGQDTDVGSSLAWLWSRCVAAPQPGAALPAGELAAGSGGADEPVHPVAAPMSRMDTYVLIRLVSTLRGLGGDVVDEGGQAGLVEEVGGAHGHVAGDVVEGGADLGDGDPGERGPG